MLTIQEPNNPVDEPRTIWQSMAHAPLFELAFRPFFLLATLFSCIALAVWVLQLGGHLTLPYQAIPPIIWHAHEMIFGFAVTIAVAFILTAGQTWTNQPSISKVPLIGFVAIWCMIRVSLYLNSNESLLIALLLTGIWWLMAIGTFTRMVVRASNRRNFLFVPILLILAGLNITVLIFGMQHHIDRAMSLMQISLLMMTIIMTIIGGRVIPFFTVRGANTSAIQTPSLIEKLVLLSALSTLLLFIAHLIFPALTAVLPWLFIITSLLHIVRVSYWKTLATFSVPLLWSLHLSYILMTLGLLIIGLSYWLDDITFSMGVHTLTIGGIAFMILSMLSRVSLGHTGRALTLRPVMIVAFAFMLASLVFRVALLTAIPVYYAWLASVIFWTGAMAIFLWVYTPILTAKRADIAPPPPKHMSVQR